MLKKKDGICRTKFAQRKPQKIALKAGRKAVTYTFAGMLPHLGLSHGCSHPVSLRRDAGHKVGAAAETSVNQI
jgi:hypothetical protein